MRPLAALLLALTLATACRGSSPSPTGNPSSPGDAVSSLPAFDDLWNHDDPAATEAAFRALLLAQPDAPPPWRLELQTQLARSLGLQRRFEEGRTLLDAVDAAPHGTPRVQTRSMLERGRLSNSSGDRTAARPLFERAYALAVASNLDGLAVDAAHMVAIAASGTEDELTWGQTALTLAWSSADPAAQRWRASLLNNIGWSRHDRGEFEIALDLWQRAVPERAQAAQEPALRIARWTVARGLRSLARHEEAIAALQAIVQDYGAAATSDGFVQEELAENQLALGQGEAARATFVAAHAALATSWIPTEEPARYQRIAQLAGLAPRPAEGEADEAEATPAQQPPHDEEPQE